MTDQRQSNGRHNEAAFREKPARVPKGEPALKHQTYFTALAVAIIAVVTAGVFFYSRL